MRCCRSFPVGSVGQLQRMHSEDGSRGGAELIVEKVKIVYAFCTKEAFADHLDELLEVCERIKRDMGQEAVTLEYNGQVKFV